MSLTQVFKEEAVKSVTLIFVLITGVALLQSPLRG